MLRHIGLRGRNQKLLRGANNTMALKKICPKPNIGHIFGIHQSVLEPKPPTALVDNAKSKTLDQDQRECTFINLDDYCECSERSNIAILFKWSIAGSILLLSLISLFYLIFYIYSKIFRHRTGKNHEHRTRSFDRVKNGETVGNMKNSKGRVSFQDELDYRSARFITTMHNGLAECPGDYGKTTWNVKTDLELWEKQRLLKASPLLLNDVSISTVLGSHQPWKTYSVECNHQPVIANEYASYSTWAQHKGDLEAKQQNHREPLQTVQSTGQNEDTRIQITENTGQSEIKISSKYEPSKGSVNDIGSCTTFENQLLKEFDTQINIQTLRPNERAMYSTNIFMENADNVVKRLPHLRQVSNETVLEQSEVKTMEQAGAEILFEAIPSLQYVLGVGTCTSTEPVENCSTESNFQSKTVNEVEKTNAINVNNFENKSHDSGEMYTEKAPPTQLKADLEQSGAEILLKDTTSLENANEVSIETKLANQSLEECKTESNLLNEIQGQIRSIIQSEVQDQAEFERKAVGSSEECSTEGTLQLAALSGITMHAVSVEKAENLNEKSENFTDATNEVRSTTSSSDYGQINLGEKVKLEQAETQILLDSTNESSQMDSEMKLDELESEVLPSTADSTMVGQSRTKSTTEGVFQPSPNVVLQETIFEKAENLNEELKNVQEIIELVGSSSDHGQISMGKVNSEETECQILLEVTSQHHQTDIEIKPGTDEAEVLLDTVTSTSYDVNVCATLADKSSEESTTKAILQSAVLSEIMTYTENEEKIGNFEKENLTKLTGDIQSAVSPGDYDHINPGEKVNSDQAESQTLLEITSGSGQINLKIKSDVDQNEAKVLPRTSRSSVVSDNISIALAEQLREKSATEAKVQPTELIEIAEHATTLEKAENLIEKTDNLNEVADEMQSTPSSSGHCQINLGEKIYSEQAESQFLDSETKTGLVQTETKILPSTIHSSSVNDDKIQTTTTERHSEGSTKSAHFQSETPLNEVLMLATSVKKAGISKESLENLREIKDELIQPVAGPSAHGQISPGQITSSEQAESQLSLELSPLLERFGDASIDESFTCCRSLQKHDVETIVQESRPNQHVSYNTNWNSVDHFNELPELREIHSEIQSKIHFNAPHQRDLKITVVLNRTEPEILPNTATSSAVKDANVYAKLVRKSTQELTTETTFQPMALTEIAMHAVSAGQTENVNENLEDFQEIKGQMQSAVCSSDHGQIDQINSVETESNALLEINPLSLYSNNINVCAVLTCQQKMRDRVVEARLQQIVSVESASSNIHVNNINKLSEKLHELREAQSETPLDQTNFKTKTMSDQPGAEILPATASTANDVICATLASKPSAEWTTEALFQPTEVQKKVIHSLNVINHENLNEKFEGMRESERKLQHIASLSDNEETGYREILNSNRLESFQKIDVSICATFVCYGRLEDSEAEANVQAAGPNESVTCNISSTIVDNFVDKSLDVREIQNQIRLTAYQQDSDSSFEVKSNLEHSKADISLEITSLQLTASEANLCTTLKCQTLNNFTVQVNICPAKSDATEEYVYLDVKRHKFNEISCDIRPSFENVECSVKAEPILLLTSSNESISFNNLLEEIQVKFEYEQKKFQSYGIESSLAYDQFESLQKDCKAKHLENNDKCIPELSKNQERNSGSPHDSKDVTRRESFHMFVNLIDKIKAQRKEHAEIIIRSMNVDVSRECQLKLEDSAKKHDFLDLDQIEQCCEKFIDSTGAESSELDADSTTAPEMDTVFEVEIGDEIIDDSELCSEEIVFDGDVEVEATVFLTHKFDEQREKTEKNQCQIDVIRAEEERVASPIISISRVLHLLRAGLYEQWPAELDTLDAVGGIMQEAGLESSNLIFGIDYTASNKYQGDECFSGRSLHHIEEGLLNPYQQVITIFGKTLAPFAKSDTYLTAFGFGDAATMDESVFQLKPDAFCSSFQEILDLYNDVTPQIILGGPTNFAPLIYEAIYLCKKARQYHILVIVADGQVTNERATRRSIVDACNYPLSIIVVGVGDGPWDMMRVFDDSLPKRPWDNFHFVEFNRLSQYTNTNFELMFAAQSLLEIPEQYKTIKRLGLLNFDDLSSSESIDKLRVARRSSRNRKNCPQLM